MAFPSWLDPAEIGTSIWWLVIAACLIVAQLWLRRFAEHQHDRTWVRAVRATLHPFMFIVVVLLARSLLHLAPTDAAQEFIAHTLNIMLIVFATWWILAAAKAAKETALSRFDVTVADNYHARQVHTRISVLYRVFMFFVILISMAFVLMTFDGVRAIGTSLLAGAGVTGIVLGFAAQKTLGSIITGIQIAITQPIKIEDAVVIEGEWGWIEEITLTYIVVRIWDLRRMIIPITYFNDHPFQNWTRQQAEIIGTVVIYTDYTLEVDPLRQELTRLLEKSEYWNGRVNVLQVIDATEKTMKLRALMTAKDSPTAWNLRCEVREGLITYIQTRYPDALPKMRIEMDSQTEPSIEGN